MAAPMPNWLIDSIPDVRFDRNAVASEVRARRRAADTAVMPATKAGAAERPSPRSSR